jgi:hypothetical protein
MRAGALHLRHLKSGAFATLAFEGVHVRVPSDLIRFYADKPSCFAAVCALGWPVGVKGRAIMVRHAGLWATIGAKICPPDPTPRGTL